MDLEFKYAMTFRPDDLKALFAPVRPELTHTPAGLHFLGVIRDADGSDDAPESILEGCTTARGSRNGQVRLG